MREGISHTWKLAMVALAVALLVVLGHRLLVAHYAAHLLDTTLSDIDNEQNFSHQIEFGPWLGWRGIGEVRIGRRNDEDTNPLVVARQVEISPEWRSLLRGDAVADISIGELEINLLREDFQRVRDTLDPDEGRELLQILKDMPINALRLREAYITFYDASHEAPVSFQVTDISLEARNLVTPPEGGGAPATAALFATTSGGGRLSAYAWAELAGEKPAMTFDIALQNLSLRDISDFIEAYTAVEVESGHLNIWSQLSLANEQLEGFVDQKIEGLQFESLEQPSDLISKQFGAMALQALRDDADGDFTGTVEIHANLAGLEIGPLNAMAELVKLAMVRMFNLKSEERLTASDLSD